MPEKTEAQKKAQKKYMEKFVEIKVRVTPEKRTAIQEHAQTMGESATTFINRAIDTQISQDRRNGPSEALQGPLGAGVVSLPSEAYERAVAASEAAGEGLPDFVVRAVETQAQRDKASLAMGINPATGGRGGAEAGGTHGN